MCVLGHTGLGDTPLWGSVWQTDGEKAVVWRPESSSIRSWREATIYLGRISGPFHIQLHSRRSEGKQGDVSIDQMKFLDCALPGKEKLKKKKLELIHEQNNQKHHSAILLIIYLFICGGTNETPVSFYFILILLWFFIFASALVTI